MTPTRHSMGAMSYSEQSNIYTCEHTLPAVYMPKRGRFEVESMLLQEVLDSIVCMFYCSVRVDNCWLRSLVEWHICSCFCESCNFAIQRTSWCHFKFDLYCEQYLGPRTSDSFMQSMWNDRWSRSKLVPKQKSISCIEWYLGTCAKSGSFYVGFRELGVKYHHSCVAWQCFNVVGIMSFHYSGFGRLCDVFEHFIYGNFDLWECITSCYCERKCQLGGGFASCTHILKVRMRCHSVYIDNAYSCAVYQLTGSKIVTFAIHLSQKETKKNSIPRHIFVESGTVCVGIHARTLTFGLAEAQKPGCALYLEP